MASQHEIRAYVTAKIIAALQASISPWHRAWSSASNTGFHTNVISQRQYSGVNPLLLQIAALEQGLQSKWWGTAEEWSSLGGRIRWQGTLIVLRTRYTGRLREQVVYCADQVEDVPQFQVQVPTVEGQPDFQAAEQLIQATGADIRECQGDKAWYHYPPAPGDFISIPSKFDFILGLGGLRSWYDTIFHELCHWSEVRLGWDSGYSRNELRAEMGAALLSATLNIPTFGLTSHHFNHVDAWVDALRRDSRTIFRVAAGACAAVNFILAFGREEVPVSS